MATWKDFSIMGILIVQSPPGSITANQKWVSEGETLVDTRAWTTRAVHLGQMAIAWSASYVSYIKAVRLPSAASVGFSTSISAELSFVMHENPMKVLAHHGTAA
jgi:hypothetical protein